MNKLPPLASLRAFEAAARHLSFKRAAEELGVTPTAVSHQIRLLEDTIGMRLFERLPRKVALTETGSQLYPVFRDAFSSMTRALGSVTREGSRKAFTLTSTTGFTAKWLVPRIARFNATHPQITLRLYPSDAVTELGTGAADCAIRYGKAPFKGLVAEPLFTERFAPVCSPLLEIRNPEDLFNHTLLHSEWRRNDEFTPSWKKWFGHAGLSGKVPEVQTILTDDSHVIQAAVAAQGIALASTVLVREEIEQGLLIQPFAPELEGLTYHFVYPETMSEDPNVMAFGNWLLEELAGTPKKLRTDRKETV
ncbi:transcriptional regulator GcvA [Roseibium aggregatum]|uniref:Transcriptional regulator GcvA n=1 Tax=Roseibium aggregatum TaxID=187304 RepID=A0A939EKX8_9HYPH|nr:transcriptional regulator GcvA [Roseibium aggregatum]MBN9673644.1 transcriptional regulator GcvA [Roseibium aggregatum]